MVDRPTAAVDLEALVCATRHLLWLLCEGLDEDGHDVPEPLMSAALLALEHFEEQGVPWADKEPMMSHVGVEQVRERLHWLAAHDEADR